MAQLIDGRGLANELRAVLPARIARLPRPPGLGVVLVGNDHASELYVKLKQTAAEAAGIRFLLQRFMSDATQEMVRSTIDTWNADPEIDAVLVQLPLPAQLAEDEVVQRIHPEKDADGFHRINTDRYLSGTGVNPPSLIEGVMRLIQATGRSLDRTRATIVARTSIFTDCLTHALETSGAAVELLPPDGTHHHSTIGADVVVVAAGRPKLITGDDLKPHAIAIDVGINKLPDGHITGDIDQVTARPVVDWITPVPGGVGPMTIAMLLENVIRLAERNEA